MTQEKGVPTYMVRLFVSRIEKYVILSLYCLLAAITLVLPVLWCVPLISILSLNVMFILNKRAKYTHLTTQPDGSLLLEDSAGQTRCVQIRPESVVYPFLVILTIQHDYRERLLLWPDSADTTALRHLRIWLYWYWPTLLHSAKQH